MIAERLEQIRQKITLLKRYDYGEVFGSEKHKYRSTVVSLNALTALEQNNGITLPEDLRCFLLTIGTGTGPDYGIYAVDEMLEQYKLWAEYTDENSTMAGTFEFSNSDVADLVAKKLSNPKEFSYKRLSKVNGLLPLHTEGCTYYSFIVLTGEQRGMMWSVDTNEFDAFPLCISFLDWYEQWLDESLLKVKIKTAPAMDELNPYTKPAVPARNWWQRLLGD